MTTTVSVLLVLALWALVTLPLAFAWRRFPASKTMLGLAIAIGAISFVQSGLIGSSLLATPISPKISVGQVSSGACVQIMDLLTENRIVLTTPTAQRLVVNGPLWDQLPKSARNTVMQCVSPGGTGGENVEIVRKPAT